MPLAGRALSGLKQRLHSVALVGIDGSGKSTQVQLLGRRLAERNKRVVFIHPFGRKLLSFLPQAAQRPSLGFGSGRRPGVQRVAAGIEMLDVAAYVWVAYIRCVALALSGEREVWLVSDRSFDDLLVKHRYLRTFSVGALAWLRGLAPRPERTIWLQTQPEVAMQRDGEFRLQYYQELHADYEAAAQEQRWQIVADADRSREAIAADIARVLIPNTPPAPAATESQEFSAKPGV
jgi:thymidylate kinase